MAWSTVFVDGFDHYATAELPYKWSVVSNGIAINTSIFRNTGKSMFIGTSSPNVATKALTSARNFCIGFGYYNAGAPPGATVGAGNAALFALCNTLGGSGAGQCGLAHTSDGLLHAVRAELGSTNFNSATDLGVTTTVLPIGSWIYIEVRVFIDNTAGQFEIRVNGVTELNLSGIDTQYAAVDYATVLTMKPINNTYIDDLYIRTSTATSAEVGGFLGDVKIKPYYPDADGTYAQMTCSTGSTHYTLVDETAPTLTDYVSSSTAAQKDSFSFQPISETGSIKGVQLSVWAAKDDAGFRAIDLFTKSGATEDFGTTQSLSTTAVYKTKVWEKDPNTVDDWSQTNLNNAEFGVRISS